MEKAAANCYYAYQSIARYGRVALVVLMLLSYVASFTGAKVITQGTCPQSFTADGSCVQLTSSDTLSCTNSACPLPSSNGCTNSPSQAGDIVQHCVSVTAPICSIYTNIKSAIFILGLLLMIIGAALFAGSNIMPSQSKGKAQGYGMEMVIGGVIGVLIAVLAPYILNLITGNPNIAGTCGS